MGKFGRKNWKGKIVLIIKVFRDLYRSHIVNKIPASKYTLSSLVKTENGYRNMTVSMGSISQILAKELKKEGVKTVLDVPSGSGNHAHYFLDLGLKYSGMDLSENAIAIALLKFPRQQFFNMSIYDADIILQDKMFDVVYCCAMLEHIGNWQKAIDNMIYLARKKVIIVFYEGLIDSKENYLEFHEFTDKKLLEFEVLPDYGYKPIVTKQLCQEECFVFEQAGNYDIDINIAEQVSGIRKDVLKSKKFNWNSLSQTISERYLLFEMQNQNIDYDNIYLLSDFLEKRMVKPHECGYFLNRYSKNKVLSYIESKNFKVYLRDMESGVGKLATVVEIIK